jgi:tRNA G46 methylase TrmB
MTDIISETIHVKDVYDKIANVFSATRLYWWPWVKQYIGTIPTNSIVIDIGCGNGRNMLYENDRINYVGIDNC